MAENALESQPCVGMIDGVAAIRSVCDARLSAAALKDEASRFARRIKAFTSTRTSAVLRRSALDACAALAMLRAVHHRIAPALEARGLMLLAQHVDAMSTATLVDIFRAEEDSCLLGTDAVRDGVDIPGRALRLIVFDRVPWPRPDVLHRARKPVFGGAQYADRIARLRLRQAYGRLIRRADDRGVFVVLDRALPSRLLSAFPRGVAIARLPLAEAAEATARFLESSPALRA